MDPDRPPGEDRLPLVPALVLVVLALGLLAGLLAAPARAGSGVETDTVELPFGGAMLLHAPRARPAPLVVLLPDAVSDPMRGAPYAEALLGLGLAVAEPGLGEDPLPPVEDVLFALHGHPWLRAGEVGLLGLGAGGRAALALAGEHRTVALDPGCEGVRVPPGAAPLIVVAGDAGGEPPCRIEGAAHVAVLPLGHGWDVAEVPGAGAVMLPRPDGPGRRRAEPDPGATRIIARAAAEFLAAGLRPRPAGATRARPVGGAP